MEQESSRGRKVERPQGVAQHLNISTKLWVVVVSREQPRTTCVVTQLLDRKKENAASLDLLLQDQRQARASLTGLGMCGLQEFMGRTMVRDKL